MNRVNLLGNYPNPKNKRYVSENLRTINHRIVASYRGKEFYDGKKQNKFTVSRKIENKKGRCVLFDSRRYHSAGKCPLGKVRVVVNTMIGCLNDL